MGLSTGIEAREDRTEFVDISLAIGGLKIPTEEDERWKKTTAVEMSMN